jgi:hypothetical protein
MSILADIFVSTPEAAADYGASHRRGRSAHIAKYQPVEYSGLTPLEFGTLWALIADEQWSAKSHMLEEVSYGEGNESWLFRFQVPYVSLLAGLTDANVDRHAAAWANSEELKLSGATADDVRPIVNELRRLAIDAQGSNKGMYLWGSL